MDASNLAKMTADEEILRFPTTAFAANRCKGGLQSMKEKVRHIYYICTNFQRFMGHN
jgi:hypothetical protein